MDEIKNGDLKHMSLLLSKRVSEYNTQAKTLDLTDNELKEFTHTKQFKTIDEALEYTILNKKTPFIDVEWYYVDNTKFTCTFLNNEELLNKTFTRTYLSLFNSLSIINKHKRVTHTKVYSSFEEAYNNQIDHISSIADFKILDNSKVEIGILNDDLCS